MPFHVVTVVSRLCLFENESRPFVTCYSILQAQFSLTLTPQCASIILSLEPEWTNHKSSTCTGELHNKIQVISMHTL